MIMISVPLATPIDPFLNRKHRTLLVVAIIIAVLFVFGRAVRPLLG